MAEDIKKILEEYKEETKRHFDVVAENLEKNIVGAMKEELQTHGQQITALQGQAGKIEAKLEKMDASLAAIETTIELANLPVLKQKVMALEKQ